MTKSTIFRLRIKEVLTDMDILLSQQKELLRHAPKGTPDHTQQKQNYNELKESRHHLIQVKV